MALGNVTRIIPIIAFKITINENSGCLVFYRHQYHFCYISGHGRPYIELWQATPALR